MINVPPVRFTRERVFPDPARIARGVPHRDAAVTARSLDARGLRTLSVTGGNRNIKLLTPITYPLRKLEMRISMFTRALRVATVFGGLLVAGYTLPQSAIAAPKCAPATTAHKEVVAAMEGFIAALRAGDLQRFQQVTTSDFYVYDGGMRLTGPALMELIGKAQASGKHYEWSVTEAELHVECNLAWLTYVNQGALEDASGRQPMTWLESAILEYADQRWRIRFAHSTRAAKTP